MLSFPPRYFLDEILNLIESVSEGFPTYPCLSTRFLITLSNLLPKCHFFSKFLQTALLNKLTYYNTFTLHNSSKTLFFVADLTKSLIICCDIIVLWDTDLHESF